MDLRFFPIGIVVTMVGICCTCFSVFAQEPGLTDPLTANLPAQEAELWEQICSDADDPPTCRISYTLFLDRTVDGETKRLGRVLLAQVSNVTLPGVDEDPVLHLAIGTPLGVDLRGGLVFRVDEGEETNLKYLQCTNRGCDVGQVMSNELVQAMRMGKQLFVGFRGWGADELLVFSVSLIGFTRALEWLQLQR